MNQTRTRSLPRLTATIVFALLGLAVAAGVTYAASRLVSQPIGISSEPQHVGDALAPVSVVNRTTTVKSPSTKTTPKQVPITPSQPPTTSPQTTAPSVPAGDGDDDHGRRRSHDGDGDSDD